MLAPPICFPAWVRNELRILSPEFNAFPDLHSRKAPEALALDHVGPHRCEQTRKNDYPASHEMHRGPRGAQISSTKAPLEDKTA